MALYRSWMYAIVRRSRSFTTFVRTGDYYWFRELENHPEVTSFLKQTNLSDNQWITFKNKVEANANVDRAISLDVVIMQLCISQENYSLGKAYMKYLIENKTELNAAIVGKYFRILYSDKEALTDDERRQILSLYHDLRVKYPLLDGSTCEHCILALSLTEKWRETEELLEMLKISCDSASTICYSAISIAAFKDGDSKMGWKYFEELTKLNKKPSTEAYTAYVDYCLKNVKKAEDRADEIGKLFNFLAEHNLLPDKILMERVKSEFKNLGWIGNFTSISHTGTCAHCRRTLTPLKLSKEDFSHLSKTVYDKVVVGNDVYSKTTPQELRRFLKFVEKSRPYDVVIDGLNVAYTSKKSMNISTAAKQLAMLVRHFLDMNKVVLVLGRRHMSNWDEKSMNYIKNNAFLFLTNNLSWDDIYLLYATLSSGPETTFVSDDLMRQHKFILKDTQLQRTFKQWQMTHQSTVTFEKRKMFIQPPLSYLPIAQKGDKCWHIPYRLSQDPLTESYRAPQDWLCLQCSNSSSQ